MKIIKFLKNKIVNLVTFINHKYSLFTNKIPINLYSAAIAYFLTIVLLPLTEMVNKVLSILNIKEDTAYANNILIDIVYFISLIWVTSKLLNIFMKIVSQIFNVNQNALKRRILAFIKMFALLFMVVLSIFIITIIEEIITYLINERLAFFKNVFIAMLFKFIFTYVFYTIVFYFLYKLIIPCKISHQDLLFVSIVMVVSAKILLTILGVRIFKDSISFYYLKSFFTLYCLSYLFVITLLYLKKKYLPLNDYD